MVTTVYAMQIQTTNDSSGNPRRGWLIYGADGALVGFADDNSACVDSSSPLKRVARVLSTTLRIPGDRVANDQYIHNRVMVIELGVIDVPPKEYRTARKHPQL